MSNNNLLTMESFITHWMDLSRAVPHERKELKEAKAPPPKAQRRVLSADARTRVARVDSGLRKRQAPTDTRDSATPRQPVRPPTAPPRANAKDREDPGGRSGKGPSPVGAPHEGKEGAGAAWEHRVLHADERQFLQGDEKVRRVKQYDRWVCDVGIRGLQNMNLAAAGARVDHQNRRVQILDFSFCNLREMAQVFTAQPRSGRVRKRAVWGEQSQTTAPAPPSPAASDRPTDRLQSEHANADEEEEGVQEEAELIPQYYANALKLNNNQLVTLSTFADTLHNLIFEAPRHLTSLDLSFNGLAALPHAWGDLPLQALYLHSNNLRDLDEAQKLRPLRRTLTALTLHDNALIQTPGYRHTVIALLPGLKALDFSTLTASDRADARQFTALARAMAEQRARSRFSG